VSGERLLVVDDERDAREGIRAILESAGYQVATAAGGAEALELLGQRPFDLLLLDVMMPGVGGLAVLREVARQLPDVPVVLITAHASLGMAVEAMGQGAQGLVLKPFDVDNLLAVVDNVLEKRRLREENSRVRAYHPLLKLNQALLSEAGMDQMAEQVLEIVSSMSDTDLAVLALWSEAASAPSLVRHLASSHILEGDVCSKLETRLCRWARGSASDLFWYGASRDQPGGNSDGKDLRSLIPQLGISDLLCVRLKQQGQAGSLICLARDGSAPPFSRGDAEIVQMVGRQALAMLENARLRQELERRVDELVFLNRVGHAVTSSLDPEEIPTTVVREMAHALRTEAGSVLLLDEASGELIFEAVYTAEAEKMKGLRVPLDQGIVGWVAREGRPLLVPDVRKDPRFYPEVDRSTGFVTRSILAVPLEVKGKVIGVIEVVNKIGSDFDRADVELLSSLARSAAIAIENARLYRALENRMAEIQRTQSQLIQSAKMAAVGQLTAGVAHELNNPLSVVLGFSELLLRDTAPDDPRQADLEIIARQARRAREIVADLLDFSRQSEFELQKADLNQVVQESLALVRRQLEKEGITLEERYAHDLPPLLLNADRMKQVFLNLVTNASHAMSRGGTLSVTSEWVGDEVAVQVADTGEGIPAEHLSRIFEPFFTTKPAGQGTGLGLSVSLGIVQDHGGRIEVESRVGEGSTFTVWLPASSADGRHDGPGRREGHGR
jgi:signal transduction histidine kinase/CheY-like chemotaxis protein